MTTGKVVCNALIDVAVAHGMSDIIASPGSRNAPLLLAARANKDVRLRMVIDERSAAFIALGMAATSRKPVGLICTSGTALLNYAPAVAEAFYRGIPLIVMSADRPMQWIDQDDSQTLRQFEALANFVKNSYDLPETDSADRQMTWYANRVANDAMITALRGRPGPVHINVQLDIPLGILASAKPRQRIITLTEGSDRLAENDVRELASEIAESRVLIVAGFMPPDNKLTKALKLMALLPNVFILAETPANIHVAEACSIIDSLLVSLSEDEKKAMRPDVVITLGGALVSRFLKTYLRDNPHARHWMIGHAHTTVDCFCSLTRRIEADPAPLLHRLAVILSHNAPTGEYAAKWRVLQRRAESRHDDFMETIPWSDLKAFAMLLPLLPEGTNLHLSNGTPIRYAQLFRTPWLHAVYCNRGVSGIDGCTSTAIGSSVSFPGLTVLISGDMSFSYDIGALASSHIPDRFKAVVISNRGGDIFRFIGSTSNLPAEQREELFCVAPNLPLRKLAEAYGFRYFCAASGNELETTAKEFIVCRQKSILEINTPAEMNSDVLKQYMNMK